jgi:hypothetical protein
MGCCAQCSTNGVIVRCRNTGTFSTDFGPNKVINNNILAEDINDLRDAINAELTIRRDCPHCCGSPSNISGSNFSVEDIISAAQWNKVREGIDQLAADPGSVGVGSSILASKVNNYRDAIHQLEDDCLCDSNCPGNGYCSCNNQCGCDGYHSCCGNSSSS